MSCPNIYIGPDSSHAPPSPYWTNSAIVPPSDTLTRDVPVTISVTVQNSGDASPPSTLELYWSDPTTGFAAVGSQLIGRVGDVSTWTVPAHTDIPPADGTAITNFAWTPDATALGTNGGHVCLLARTQFNSSPGGGCPNVSWDPASPQTDPHSGVHNIQLVVPTPHKSPRPFHFRFAFAATNTSHDIRPGLLQVRMLDPNVEEDRERLRVVLFQPHIDRALRCCGKTALPKAVFLGAGRECVVLPPKLPLVFGERQGHPCSTPAPRLGNLGPLESDRAQRLLAPGCRFEEVNKGVPIHLTYGESRQMILDVVAQDVDEQVYVVEVEHVSADGKPVGGLTFVFVNPCDHL